MSLLDYFEIVLDIGEVHALPQVRHRVVIQFIVVRRAEDEIGQAVHLLLHAREAIERAGIGEEGRVAEGSREVLLCRTAGWKSLTAVSIN